jgi:hypothetical protein
MTAIQSGVIQDTAIRNSVLRDTAATAGVRPAAGHVGAGMTGVRGQRLDHASQIASGRQSDVPAGPDGRDSVLVAGQPFTTKHTVVVAD